MNEEQFLEELNKLLEEPEERELPVRREQPRQEAPQKKQKSKKSKNSKKSKRGKTGKTVLLTLAVLFLVLAIGAGVIWMNYHVIDFTLYEKDAQSLNLLDKDISVSHYEKLKAAMPDCEILWNVPFQGGALADNVTEVTVTSLTAEDVKALEYLTDLKTVHAKDCADYDQLLALQRSRPDVQVLYHVLVSGQYYEQDATVIKVDSMTEEELSLLTYLPGLKTVEACGNESAVDFTALREYCSNAGIAFQIRLGKTAFSCDTEEVSVEGITEEEIYLLSYLDNLKKLHLVKPKAKAETVRSLRQTYPEAEITWEVEFAGQLFADNVTEVDLSKLVVDDLAQVEAGMAYLPDATNLLLGLCGVDEPKWGNSKSKLAASAIENEDLAAYRDRVRDQYKVVWTVRLGPSIALRTDADNFMPNHFGVGVLPDSYAYNLRYCEDMVCLDVGHMTLTDISFVEYMPKLKYLILAWTEVQYIEPIRSCKNLVFLELDNSCIRDLSPLVDCTALEDLNIGNTWPDVTPLTKMPWLKNVYMIFGSRAGAWQISQALPDTRVVATGNATVGGNWRKLQNYYDMRDCLGMYYMD